MINEISKNADVIAQYSVEMNDKLINQVKIIDSPLTSFKKIIEEVIPKINIVKNFDKDINEDKNTILARIDSVSSISLEVSASLEEIVASVEEMNAFTEEVATSLEILSNMIREMFAEVDKLKI